MKSAVKTDAFVQALEKLNDEQREAVETIEGPVMVIAGPGTGKTQILTLRIANILLRTDMQPENILALTFTDSGAKAMRERLRTYIGVLAYRVPIYTFHGFAEYLISRYPDSFPHIIGGRPATDIEKISIVESIVADPTLKIVRPLGNPTYYVRPLESMISTLKQENISPDRLREIIAAQEEVLRATEKIHQKGAHKGKVRGEYAALEKVIEKNRELLYVYVRYEALLREGRLYDFQDMILEAVRALSLNEPLLRELQESFQYVLADEHQDVNGAQNKILELLTNFHDSPNIFVVGDEKQAIYRFQGASLENFLYFTDIFPTTKTIALTTNYRSGQSILDAAQAAILTDDELVAKLRTPLAAFTTETALTEIRAFSHQAIEDEYVVTVVRQKLAQGVPAHEIAVIVRTNREVETMTQLLRKTGVAVVASADGDILSHPLTATIEALINAVISEKSEEALFAVMHGAYWGLTFSDVVRVAAARRRENSLADILTSHTTLKTLGVGDPEKASAIMVVLEEARRRQVYEAPHRVLEYLLQKSGLLDYVLAHDPYEGVRVVRRIYDEIEAMVIRDNVAELREVVAILTLRRHYGLPLEAPYVATTQSAVQVLTAHKSKGLEYQVVFLPHLHDTNWGGSRRSALFSVPVGRVVEDKAHEEDDERRLLYVAMTRAKRELYLSYAAESIAGKPLLTSRLLTDAVVEKMTVQDVVDFENSFSPLATMGDYESPMVSTEFLAKILSERGLSATALNNLVRNPWDFLYRNVLRVPETQALSMLFGTAVHSVLEKTTAHFTKMGHWPTMTEIKHWLDSALRRLPLTQSDYTSLHEKAFSRLAVYLEHLTRTVLAPTREEFSLRVTLPLSNVPGLAEIPLTGKLDRLDLAEDGRVLRVIDYKTGKPKSRGEIEGKTAQSDGAYKRQLVFYALLLSLSQDERLMTREGVLSFVEPTSGGVIKEEVFTITDEEIAALKTEIENSIRQFMAGGFLHDETCIAECAYPQLARALSQRLVD